MGNGRNGSESFGSFGSPSATAPRFTVGFRQHPGRGGAGARASVRAGWGAAALLGLATRSRAGFGWRRAAWPAPGTAGRSCCCVFQSPAARGAKYSKTTLGRTHTMKNKTDQKYKPPDTFDFPDNSAVSSIDRMGENEQDEEPYENFAPPLHSTAIYADEEFSQQCGSSVPSTLQRKEAGRSLNTSENEATESVKYHTKEKIHKKRKMSHGKRKKPRSKDVNSDSDLSDTAFIWCLEGKKTSDIMELDVVLSTFEKTFLEYKQRIESRVCKEAINKFYSNIKEELIKKIQEVQLLKNLKRRNVKMISDIEKKRQCLMEVQDELLRLEPQLKQLQIKYDELKERKSSFKNATYFLHNLKELHQDYSDVQETKPEAKETYDSSSLPALLLKARGLLGAENHLQNISHQLEKLLGQE